MEKEPPKHYTPRQFFVCYLDVLGIREKLFSNINYHSSEISPEQQAIIDNYSELISNSLDVLSFAKDLFSKPSYDLIKAFCSDSLLESLTDSGKEEVLRRLQSVKFSMQSFSDSLLIYAPYDEENYYNFVDSFTFLFSFYSFLFLSKIDQGILFRGALTIGTAWEIRNNFLFGPAVHEAYLLESTAAKHPRIILSPSLAKFVDRLKQEAIRRNLQVDQGLLRDAFVTDYDGVLMLNYLSVSNIVFLRSLFDVEYYISIIQKAFAALKRGYDTYRASKSTSQVDILSHEAELARRYYDMLRFFKSKEKAINDYLSSLRKNPISFVFDLLNDL